MEIPARGSTTTPRDAAPVRSEAEESDCAYGAAKLTPTEIASQLHFRLHRESRAGAPHERLMADVRKMMRLDNMRDAFKRNVRLALRIAAGVLLAGLAQTRAPPDLGKQWYLLPSSYYLGGLSWAAVMVVFAASRNIGGALRQIWQIDVGVGLALCYNFIVFSLIPMNQDNIITLSVNLRGKTTQTKTMPAKQSKNTLKSPQQNDSDCAYVSAELMPVEVGNDKARLRMRMRRMSSEATRSTTASFSRHRLVADVKKIMCLDNMRDAFKMNVQLAARIAFGVLLASVAQTRAPAHSDRQWYLLPSWYYLGALSWAAMMVIFAASRNVGGAIMQIWQIDLGVGIALLYNLIVFSLIPMNQEKIITVSITLKGDRYDISLADWSKIVPLIILFSFSMMVLPVSTNVKQFAVSTNLYFMLTIVSPMNPIYPTQRKDLGDGYFGVHNLVRNFAVYCIVGAIGTFISFATMLFPYPLFAIREFKNHTHDATREIREVLNLVVDAYCFRANDIRSMDFFKLKLEPGTVLPSIFTFFSCKVASSGLYYLLNNCFLFLWVTVSMYVYYSSSYVPRAGVVSSYMAASVVLEHSCRNQNGNKSLSYSSLTENSLGILILMLTEALIQPQSARKLLRANIKNALQKFQTSVTKVYRHHLTRERGSDTNQKDAGQDAGSDVPQQTSVDELLDAVAIKELHTVLDVDLPRLLADQEKLLQDASSEPDLWRPVFSRDKYSRVLAICRTLLTQLRILSDLVTWYHGRRRSTVSFHLPPTDSVGDGPLDGHHRDNSLKLWRQAQDTFAAALTETLNTLVSLFDDQVPAKDADDTVIFLQMKEAFRIADVNRRGEVDASELASLLNQLLPYSAARGAVHMEQYVAEFMKLVDRNGDGKVSYAEFMEALNHGFRLELEIYETRRGSALMRPQMSQESGSDMDDDGEVVYRDHDDVGESDSHDTRAALLPPSSPQPTASSPTALISRLWPPALSPRQAGRSPVVHPVSQRSPPSRPTTQQLLLNVEAFSIKEAARLMRQRYGEHLLAETSARHRVAVEDFVLVSCLVCAVNEIATQLVALHKLEVTGLFYAALKDDAMASPRVRLRMRRSSSRRTASAAKGSSSRRLLHGVQRAMRLDNIRDAFKQNAQLAARIALGVLIAGVAQTRSSGQSSKQWALLPADYFLGGLSWAALMVIFAAARTVGGALMQIWQIDLGVALALLYNVVVYSLIPMHQQHLVTVSVNLNGNSYDISLTDWAKIVPLLLFFTFVVFVLPIVRNSLMRQRVLTVVSPMNPIYPMQRKDLGDGFFNVTNLVHNFAIYCLVGVVGTLISLATMLFPFPIFAIREFKSHVHGATQEVKDLLNLIQFIHLIGSLINNLDAMTFAIELETCHSAHTTLMERIQRKVYVLQTETNDLLDDIATHVLDAATTLPTQKLRRLETRLERLIKAYTETYSSLLTTQIQTPQQVGRSMPLNLFLYSFHALIQTLTLVQFENAFNQKNFTLRHRISGFLRHVVKSLWQKEQYPRQLLVFALRTTFAVFIGVCLSTFVFAFSSTVPNAIAMVAEAHIGGTYGNTANRLSGLVAGTVLPSIFSFFICKSRSAEVYNTVNNVVLFGWTTLSMYVFYSSRYFQSAGMVSAYMAASVLLEHNEFATFDAEDTAIFMQMKEAFRVADVHRRGQVDATELAVLLEQLMPYSMPEGTVKMDQYVTEFMQLVDRDHDGIITYAEFMDALNHGFRLELEIYNDIRSSLMKLVFPACLVFCCAALATTTVNSRIAPPSSIRGVADLVDEPNFGATPSHLSQPHSAIRVPIGGSSGEDTGNGDEDEDEDEDEDAILPLDSGSDLDSNIDSGKDSGSGSDSSFFSDIDAGSTTNASIAAIDANRTRTDDVSVGDTSGSEDLDLGSNNDITSDVASDSDSDDVSDDTDSSGDNGSLVPTTSASSSSSAMQATLSTSSGRSDNVVNEPRAKSVDKGSATSSVLLSTATSSSETDFLSKPVLFGGAVVGAVIGIVGVIVATARLRMRSVQRDLIAEAPESVTGGRRQSASSGRQDTPASTSLSVDGDDSEQGSEDEGSFENDVL
ncbi:hypothetical protein P43SY_000516 [Pythium insidiosum]|uniref:EF-hand domain-containing protein n=1 Tax=Pythium insidiosum TaxID=114742 RepID=A0AAD5LNT1_PYTIN|nr:hypothetical protein P43SY_000516 [Pythium insidiosum]